jgi:hypothetical protein
MYVHYVGSVTSLGMAVGGDYFNNLVLGRELQNNSHAIFYCKLSLLVSVKVAETIVLCIHTVRDLKLQQPSSTITHVTTCTEYIRERNGFAEQ